MRCEEEIGETDHTYAIITFCWRDVLFWECVRATVLERLEALFAAGNAIIALHASALLPPPPGKAAPVGPVVLK
eukprot:3018368-Amphidinium_carterae.1